jgi:hypothetical protein
MPFDDPGEADVAEKSVRNKMTVDTDIFLKCGINK